MPQDHHEENSPCFSWYPSDWRGSRHVRNMSWKERGFYRECLDWAWDLNGLPEDTEEIRFTLGANPTDFKKLWPTAARMFVLIDGRWRNARQEREREKKEAWRRRASDGGKALAAKHAASRVEEARDKHGGSSPEAVLVSSPEASEKQPGSSASKQPGSTASHALSHAHALAHAHAQNEPSARSKRPIFTGQRLTVFEWMLDDLTKLLGTFTEAFDLHSWFFDLDAQAVRTNLVIPQRDSGNWLHAQTLAEAQRRGLPIASSQPVLGKANSRLAAAVANIKAEAR